MNTVLLLCYYQSPYGGNFVPSLVALEDNLRKRDARCVYVFPKKAEERAWFQELSSKSSVITIDFNQSKLNFLKNLKLILKQYKVDTVYAHFGKAIEVEVTSIINPNIRCVVHIHSDFNMGHVLLKEKLKIITIYQLLSRRVRFISVSKDFVRYNPRKITYIPNALATKRFHCKHIGRAETRLLFGVKDDEILCTVFGWAPEVKGVDIAVNAVGELINKGHTKIKLMIVCGKAIAKPQMQGYIKDHTLYSGKETFLIYAEPTEDVFSYHEAADVLLVTSRSEGFSYTLLEMLSLGKPCVTSDIPGVEWSWDYPCVFRFSVGDELQCGERVLQALECEYDREQVTTRVKYNFSIDKWSDDIANILLEKERK